MAVKGLVISSIIKVKNLLLKLQKPFYSRQEYQRNFLFNASECLKEHCFV